EHVDRFSLTADRHIGFARQTEPESDRLQVVGRRKMTREAANAERRASLVQQLHRLLQQRMTVQSVECGPEVFLDLVEAYRLSLQIKIALTVLIKRLEEETFDHRQGTVGDRNWWKGAGFAQRLASPVHVQSLLKNVVEQRADAMVLGREPGLQESLYVALATRPGLNDCGRLLHQSHDEPAELRLLHASQSGLGHRMPQYRAQPLL